MDPDMNKYDTNHVVVDHPLMSKAELEGAYLDAWKWFFTPQHMETVMRRAAACGVSAGKVMYMLLWFFFSIRYAGVHPLDSGYFRMRFRKDCRSGFARENALTFYPRYVFEIVHNHFWMGYWLVRMSVVRQRIRYDKQVHHYTDLSLTPPQGDEYADLALFGATRGGQAAVAKRLKEDAARDALREVAVC